jgi:hypothetical protein
MNATKLNESSFLKIESFFRRIKYQCFKYSMCYITVELETNHFMKLLVYYLTTFDLTFMLWTNIFTTNNKKTSHQELNLIKLY